MMMDYLQLVVGEKFDHDMSNESMSIVLHGGTPMLIFNFTISEKDIQNFLNGTISFSLFSEKNMLFFLFKIDGFMDWSDLAFTIHLAGDEEIIDDGSYLPFSLLLIESGTNIIKGMRLVTVTPTFRSILTKILQKQQVEKFDSVAYYKNISTIYESYPKVFSMLAKSLITEKGGFTVRE